MHGNHSGLIGGWLASQMSSAGSLRALFSGKILGQGGLYPNMTGHIGGVVCSIPGQ